MIKAIIFDFDGTIVDTESCAYEAFGGIYADHGHELPLELWALGIGTVDGFDPYEDLQRRVGRTLDRDKLHHRFSAELHDRADRAELRPGVLDMLEQARGLGLSVGLASSADRKWIDRHLAGKGIKDYFLTTHTSDDVEKVKPDPALYRLAVTALGVRPEEAVAVEDSLHGLHAAKAAGMHAIVVPNPMTRHMDFRSGGADVIVESLASLPLQALLERLKRAV